MTEFPQTNVTHGLSDREAIQNQKKYGKNTLIEKTRFSFFKELFRSFFSPLIFLLLAASLISGFLGDMTSFFIIFGIVILSGLISFAQHYRAEKAAQKLKNKVLLTATVIRNGVQKEISFTQVTIGDVVVFSVGDIVPADIKIVEARELSIDESTLTGESFPADKNVDGKKLHEDIAFAGTHVVTGQATGIVYAIGTTTQLGKLSQEITQQKPQTTFDKDLNAFSILVIRLILVLSLIVFLVNAIFHHEILNSLLFAVALAVGLTPELMPVIITVSLSSGALLMEKKDVIVKFLPAIQNLGGMNILCTDKTGTITENNIILTSHENANGKKDDLVILFAKLNSFFQSGFKNPLDHAILDKTTNISTDQYTKIDEIPFDFDRKKLSVIVKEKNKNYLELIAKGTPRAILESCISYKENKKEIKLAPKKRQSLENQIIALSEQGYRIIAIAQKKIEKKNSYTKSDEEKLTFLGFLIFFDPVKKTVNETLKHLYSLGIQTKILTGDNEIITKKVCLDAGIPIDVVLNGSEVDRLTLPEIAEKAKTVNAFANLNPEQKARIITALKNAGNVVGYLGDGINDAPPLKAADVGISVNNGSDIAKDVADIILMRKSLGVLRDGVIEGRKTYANTFKYILMSLSSNFGNMMSVAIASLFLPFLPLLPTQIILIDFLYDLSQITIPADTVDASLFLSPRQWSIAFLRKFTFIFGPLSSIFDLITFGILLYFLHAAVPVFRTGWFVESFITQTLIILSIRTHIVPFFKSRPSMQLLSSIIVTLIAGMILTFSPLGAYFHFTPLPSIFIWILAGEVLLYFTLVELAKLWFYKQVVPTHQTASPAQ